MIKRLRPHCLALAVVLAFSAVLEGFRLERNSWANEYYSAAVRSMLSSLHDFFFVSSDPGGLVTIDKPPLGLWLQVASARVFGLHPLSLLLPEALCAVATVAVVYRIVAPRFGAWAGVAAAATLAVFPSFVASGRDNNLDALLLLLMALACLAGLRAVESGSWRWLLATALLVGLAFDTKTLAAYLVLPGLAAAWLVCAPGTLRRRLGLLVAATAVLAATSLVWLVAVEAVPKATTDSDACSASAAPPGRSCTFTHLRLRRRAGRRARRWCARHASASRTARRASPRRRGRRACSACSIQPSATNARGSCRSPWRACWPPRWRCAEYRDRTGGSQRCW
jgi:4-amino-4-deoxy-L-arabinose transferase-like glycosyltransferase